MSPIWLVLLKETFQSGKVLICSIARASFNRREVARAPSAIDERWLNPETRFPIVYITIGAQGSRRWRCRYDEIVTQTLSGSRVEDRRRERDAPAGITLAITCTAYDLAHLNLSRQVKPRFYRLLCSFLFSGRPWRTVKDPPVVGSPIDKSFSWLSTCRTRCTTDRCEIDGDSWSFFAAICALRLDRTIFSFPFLISFNKFFNKSVTEQKWVDRCWIFMSQRSQC